MIKDASALLNQVITKIIIYLYVVPFSTIVVNVLLLAWSGIQSAMTGSGQKQLTDDFYHNVCTIDIRISGFS